MIKIKQLLLFFVFMTSCTDNTVTDNTKANENVNKPTADRAIDSKSNSLDGDPAFVISKDTTSTQGPRSITRNILQDRNGTYWFATWEGILSYNGKFFTNVTLKENMRRFHIFSILQDKKGNLWFGTIGGGVYRYDGKAYTNFTMNDGLASNVIICMLDDVSGNIWFGTDNGVSRFDGKSFTNFTTKDGLSNNFISCIAQDKTSKIWLGTNGGVSSYDPSTESDPASLLPGRKHFTDFMNEKGKNFYRVRSIIEDKTGNIWIGSADGLYSYNGTSFTSFAKHATYYILEDKKGILWLSNDEPNSTEMTLTKYDGKTFNKIKKDQQVFGITEDFAGNIWFGTANGARKYDGKAFSNFDAD